MGSCGGTLATSENGNWKGTCGKTEEVCIMWGDADGLGDVKQGT